MSLMEEYKKLAGRGVFGVNGASLSEGLIYVVDYDGF